MRYGVSSWIYGDEELEESMQRISRYGYDLIELPGDPDTDVEKVKELLSKYNLEVSSLCGLYPLERDLSNKEKTKRKNAVNYIKKCIDIAAELGASKVIVVPSSVGRTDLLISEEKEYQYAIEELRIAGNYAAKNEVTLVLEALNRFETCLANNIEDLLYVIEEVDLENVKVMCDVFHMNIEENSIELGILKAGQKLDHVHFADSNREAPGKGHIDFKSVMRRLKEINYDGDIIMEFLPSSANPYSNRKRSNLKESLDLATMESLDWIKKIAQN